MSQAHAQLMLLTMQSKATQARTQAGGDTSRINQVSLAVSACAYF